MAGRARDGKVKPDDMEGSTFSTPTWACTTWKISSPSSTRLKPHFGRSVLRVKFLSWITARSKPGWRMKATISVDHRVSDGAEAAQFMQSLAKYLETPVLMLV
jgi:pyruvate dehydrogenase E2 component (dihydrolipoamide acetyltransferase)